MRDGDWGGLCHNPTEYPLKQLMRSALVSVLANERRLGIDYIPDHISQVPLKSLHSM